MNDTAHPLRGSCAATGREQLSDSVQSLKMHLSFYPTILHLGTYLDVS